MDNGALNKSSLNLKTNACEVEKPSKQNLI